MRSHASDHIEEGAAGATHFSDLCEFACHAATHPAPEPAIEKLTTAVERLLTAHTAPAKDGPFTITQAARRLGVSRSRTLLPAIAASLVATVRWGRRSRITMEEIERLERQGFGGRMPSKRRATQSTAPTRGERLTYDRARSRS